jgi:hypothetical protein
MTPNTEIGLSAAGGAVLGGLVAGPIGLAMPVAVALGGVLGGGLDVLFRKHAPTSASEMTEKAKTSPYSPPPPQVKQPGIPPMPPVEAQPPDVQKVAGIAMNAALAAHGYKIADMPLYMAFQRVAGLNVDGFPGTNTMTKLGQVLTAAGVSMANVRMYPWSTTGGYDGKNAPTMQEWTGNATWAGPPPLVNVTPTPAAAQVAAMIPIAVTPAQPATDTTPATPKQAQPIVTIQDVQRALNQLGMATPPLNADGIAGPLTTASVITFQKKARLTADGIAGPNTKAALQKALSGG